MRLWIQIIFIILIIPNILNAINNNNIDDYYDNGDYLNDNKEDDQEYYNDDDNYDYKSDYSDYDYNDYICPSKCKCTNNSTKKIQNDLDYYSAQSNMNIQVDCSNKLLNSMQNLFDDNFPIEQITKL